MLPDICGLSMKDSSQPDVAYDRNTGKDRLGGLNTGPHGGPGPSTKFLRKLVVPGAGQQARRLSRWSFKSRPGKDEPYRTAGGRAAGDRTSDQIGFRNFFTPLEPYRTVGSNAARGHQPSDLRQDPIGQSTDVPRQLGPSTQIPWQHDHSADSRRAATFVPCLSRRHIVAFMLALAACVFCASCGGTSRAYSVGKTPTGEGSSESRREALADEDGDGFPDSAQLGTFDDKENFRRWFTAIAETQFYQISDEWNQDQRDCAGLVRFALREALARHDYAWQRKMGPGLASVAPDVRAYTLETGPLGSKLFRTDYGTFKKTDLTDGKFSEFADARTLKNYNCRFISRDRSLARPGDLLFFYQPWVQNYPFHVMIFVGKDRVASADGTDWIVYHTGSSARDEGTVKKVRLAVLDHHPDKRWRPVTDNPNFLGFFRLKILE